MVICLGNRAHVSAADITAIEHVLRGYFNQVVTGTSVTFRVETVRERPSLTSTDLLCYLVPSFLDSVVTQMRSGAHPYANELGLTVFETGRIGRAASEVYINDFRYMDNRITAIANVVFHELMHNKLRLGDHMHGDGLSAATLDGSSQLTPANITVMRDALSHRVIQWVEGFDIPMLD